MMRSHLIDIREAHRLKRSAARASIKSLRVIPYHPVCANKERDHFLNGAATPPISGGEFGLTFRFHDTTYLRTRREVEDINAIAIDQGFGKMFKLQTPPFQGRD